MKIQKYLFWSLQTEKLHNLILNTPSLKFRNYYNAYFSAFYLIPIFQLDISFFVEVERLKRMSVRLESGKWCMPLNAYKFKLYFEK